MAHRRKNSHPLCKQKRISTVLDILSAKSKQEEEGKGNAEIQKRLEEKVPDTEAQKKLDIPDDLFKDFLALRNATNMGTAELMRKLITDYTKPADGEISDQDGHKNQKTAPPTDTDKLNEYYQEDYINSQNVDPSNQHSEHKKDSDDNDLNLTIDASQASPATPPSANLNQGYTYLFDTKGIDDTTHSNLDQSNGSESVEDVYDERSSDKDNLHQVKFENGAVTIEGTKYNPKVHMETQENANKGPPPPYPYAGMHMLSNTLPGMVPLSSLPEGLGPGVPLLPQQVPPEVLAMMNSAQINPMISGGIPESETIDGNECSTSDSLQDERKTSFDDVSTHENITDSSLSRLWSPMPAKKSYLQGSKKKSGEKGKMKLIAENTSNHGVYTSVLKLPWSKRTRTPKAVSSKHQNYAIEQTSLQDTALIPHAQQPKDDQGLHQEQPTQQSIAEHNYQDQVQQQQGIQPLQTQQPQIVFLPLPAGNIPSSQGIFIPSSSLPCPVPSPIDTQVSPSQSMMMVYPNTNVNSMGKPVRKRGRPPKIPTMAKMIEEKKPKYEASFPTFLPQTFPPAAIVLNVNNMLNTGNNVTATNKINNTMTQSEVGVPQTQEIGEISEEVNQSKNVPDSPFVPPMFSMQIPPYPGPNVDIKQENPQQTNHIHQNQVILPKPEQLPQIKNESPKQIFNEKSQFEPKNISNNAAEMKMVTTTTMSNASTGALYQEMVLSSKSLVNVRPRRRQTTSEYLKSKSTDQNFICTSFRLRSLSGNKKEKRMTQYIPGMKRRGRPPKKRLENMFEGQMVEVNQSSMEEFNQQNMLNLQRIKEQREAMVLAGHASDAHARNVLTSKAEEHMAHINNTDMPEAGIGETKFTEHGSGHESEDTQYYSPTRSPQSSASEEGYVLEEGEIEPSDANEMFQQLFHCKVCNDIIPVEKKGEHWLKHSKDNSHCLTCGSSLQTDGETVERTKCERCEKGSQKDLSPNLFCSDCGESCRNPAALRYHKITEHGSDKKCMITSGTPDSVYQCHDPTCLKTFRTKHDLRAHVIRRHDGNQQVYCIYDGCTKKFQNNLHLQEHIKFKHVLTQPSKTYKSAKFSYENEFEKDRHMNIPFMIQQDEKPIKCQLCEYSCRQQSALVWHMRKHHPEAMPAYAKSNSDSITSKEDPDEEEEGEQ